MMNQSFFNKNNPSNKLTSTRSKALEPDPLMFQQMRYALQEFVDRVEKGEITSKYHYRKFKQLLSD